MLASRRSVHTETIFFRYRDEQPIEALFHSHPQYEIYYFHEGACSFLIGDRIYELEPGDLIFMDGLTLHCANAAMDQPYIRSVCHFHADYVQRLLRIPGGADLLEPFRRLRHARLRLSPVQREEAERLLGRLSEHNVPQDKLAYVQYHLLFCELLACICRWSETLPGQAPTASTEKLQHVQDMITFVEQHYMEDLHLDDLERELHLNRHYLSKLFKQVMGVTVFHYLFERRINQSCVMMAMQPDMTLTDISYRVGFKHPAHFSRVFKRYVGMPPEAYRRQFDRPV